MSASFYDDVIFPTSIALRAMRGKRQRLTDIAVTQSGAESRAVVWAKTRRPYEAGLVVRPASEWRLIDALFEVVDGMAYGFRLKDPTDFEVAVGEGFLQPVNTDGTYNGSSGVGAGVPVFQLVKRYTYQSRSKDRVINKPYGTVALLRGGSPVTIGSGAGQAAIDMNTGLVTMVADTSKSVLALSSKAITGITKANPGVVTAVAHGFASGDKIKIASVVGMTQVNGLYFTITVLTADTFSIGVDTTSDTTYTSGGTAIKYGVTQTNPVRINSTAHGFTNGQVVYLSGVVGTTQVNNLSFTVANAATNSFDLSGIDGTTYATYVSGGTISQFAQSSETLTWYGNFHVPVRFATDELDWDVVDKQGSGELLIENGSVPLIEIRV